MQFIFIRHLTVISLLLFSSSLAAQENPEKQWVLPKVAEIVFSHPDEAIRIINYLGKEKSPEKSAYIQLLLSDAYYTKGDYNKMAESLFDSTIEFDKISDTIKAQILLRKMNLAGRLQLYRQFAGYSEGIQTLLPAFKSDLTAIDFQLDKERINIARSQYQGLSERLDSLELRVKNKIFADTKLMQKIFAMRGLFDLSLENYSEAGEHFKIGMGLFTASQSDDFNLKSSILSGMAKVHYHQRNYRQAIKLLEGLLEENKKIGNIFLEEDLTGQLSLNYLALKDKFEHQRLNDSFLVLNASVYTKETQTYNTLYDLINKEQEQRVGQQRSKLRLYTLIAIVFLLTVVLTAAVLYYINESKKIQFKEILSYLQVPNKVLMQNSGQKTDAKRLTMTSDTEKAILAKLKKFEASKRYTSKEMSLSTLSAQLDVNSKYLSEIIHNYYDDNFSTYINKLRINYIIEKLKNEPEYLNYKIKYLAEESGFSSHSNFAAVFKSITGISPGLFIDLLAKEMDKKKD